MRHSKNKNCIVCGKPFSTFTKAVSCSSVCWHILSGQKKRKERFKKFCAYCNKPFETTRERTKFCSRPCMLHGRKGTKISRPKITKVCITCQNIFIPKHSSQKYCSKKCHPSRKGMYHPLLVLRIEKQCPICGILFKSRPKENRKTCSYKCKIKLQANQHTKSPYKKMCELCNNPFETKNKNQRYCSMQCFGKSRRTVGQACRKNSSAVIRKEDMIQCAKCGYNKFMSVLERHQKDMNPSNNNISNLIVLCPTCHEEEHYTTRTGKYRRFSRLKSALP
jgi:predicted nucleic acid-binding Zn ribbon protein